MKKCFCFSILATLLLFTITAFAETVPVNKAHYVAQSFLKSKTGEIPSISSVDCAENFQLQNMYVFSDEHCFVIVSKEDAVSPILGYSLDGGFSLDAPSCVIDWLKAYDDEIESVKEKGLHATSEIENDWCNLLQGSGLEPKSRSFVEPLLQTTWDQGAPYNYFCPIEPEHSSGHTPAGCGATAMAQIMKYWGRPIRGVGSKTYTPRDHPQYGELTVNFSNTVYDWDNMPDSINENSPQEQINAVATLIYHCGVSVEMDYGPHGSSVHKKIMDDAFRNYFNYNPDLEYYSDTVFTHEQWINRLKTNLDLLMPVLYRGANEQNNNGGHIFVCDGYDENNYFHFNWGWSGNCDGYYAIGALHPNNHGDYSFRNYAIFDCAPNYSIDVSAIPSVAGEVSGGGSYPFGSSVTIHATAASGYRFVHWQDGNTDNPRTITVTNDTTYVAYFEMVPMFVVATNISPAGAGTVTGGGTYEEGTIVTLTATANPGYTFDHWDDGSTQNPRVVTVNSNLNFTAYFTQNQYLITVVANPSNAGSVSGGGAYYYGDYATLTATAYSGYEFQGWSDGSNENPHQVTVTGNATYTATFSQVGTTYYTVSAYVSPNGAGTVSGIGTFPAGSSTTLTATANAGYTFSHWNDGITTNPRTVTVNNNMSFTAYFTTQQYTITVNANPPLGGTVTGGGTYPYGATTTLTAMPNSGYSFMQWNDGNSANPRTITVTDNASYTALFISAGGETFMLTVTSGNLLLGQVAGGGIYPAGAMVEIRAIPASYSRFVKWNDGNTDNPRTVVVNSDLEFIAEFVAITNYTITVESANPDMGQTYGGGTFAEGTVTQISAVAFDGYAFTGWQDGNTQNPRTITVTSNATYTANFTAGSVKTYTLTLICNTAEGSVSGGGIYVSGSTAIIQAFPNDGFAFDKWSDNNTDNPRTFTMTGDLTLEAFFKGNGVNESGEIGYLLYPNPAKQSIRILGIDTNSQIQIYNMLGELVRIVNAGPDEWIGISGLSKGIYFIRVGGVTMRLCVIE